MDVQSPGVIVVLELAGCLVSDHLALRNETKIGCASRDHNFATPGGLTDATLVDGPVAVVINAITHLWRRWSPNTGPLNARVTRRAGTAVVAHGSIGLRRVGAHPVGGIAGAGDVALVQRRADDWVGAGAGSCLAGVGLGTGVTVVAARAVRFVGVRADAT